MPSGTKKKVAAVVAALAVAGFLGTFLLSVALGAYGSGGQMSLLLVLGLYALVILAVIAGVVLAMVQRLREIEGGEEEDAKKY